MDTWALVAAITGLAGALVFGYRQQQKNNTHLLEVNIAYYKQMARLTARWARISEQTGSILEKQNEMLSDIKRATQNAASDTADVKQGMRKLYQLVVRLERAFSQTNRAVQPDGELSQAIRREIQELKHEVIKLARENRLRGKES